MEGCVGTVQGKMRLCGVTARLRELTANFPRRHRLRYDGFAFRSPDRERSGIRAEGNFGSKIRSCLLTP